MEQNAKIDSELAAAEAALKRAEEKYGKDHLKVSHCLDDVVRILRKRGIRALDAVNMEARARAIRIKCNSNVSGLGSRMNSDIDEAFAIAANRQRAERRRRTVFAFVTVVVLGLVVGKLAFAPSRAERALLEGTVKNVHSVLPTTYMQHVVTESRAAVESAQTANDFHNKQLESFMGE